MDLDLIMDSLKADNDSNNYLLVDDDYINNATEFAALSGGGSNANRRKLVPIHFKQLITKFIYK